MKTTSINPNTNIFGWDYRTRQILNDNGAPSRFSAVHGQDGNICHVKKDSYQIITTKDVSDLAHAFISNGFNTTPYTHRNGETIGLNVVLPKSLTKVGDIEYGAIIDFRNNNTGAGVGYLNGNRLVCGNGAKKNELVGSKITVTHDMSKHEKLKLMGEAINGFLSLIKKSEEHDAKLDAIEIDREEAMRRLNSWFYAQEMPASQRTMSETEFRRMLAVDPTSLECHDRHLEMRAAFDRELGYNQKLGLKLSAYTVYATAANYLTRRREKSKSSAPDEVQIIRTSEKLLPLERLELVMA